MNRSSHFRYLYLLVPFSLSTGCSSKTREEAAAEVERQQHVTVRQAELKAAELDREKQKSIWDAEHVTFELEWRFGPHFKDSLKTQNVNKLRETLCDGFVGHTQLTSLDERTEPSCGIHHVRFAVEGEAEPVNAEAFIAALLEPTAAWSEIDSIGLRVLKIEQTSKEEHRWKTRVLLSRQGISDQRRVFNYSEHTVHWRIENDEQLEDQPVIDQWTFEKESRLDADTPYLFSEVTADAGLDAASIPDNWKGKSSDAQQYRFGVAVDDFNRDGYFDIAVAVFEGVVQLFQGGPDLKFKEVGGEMGLRRNVVENFVTTWIDYDNDGFPDLLIGDRFYRNDGGRQFIDVTQDVRLAIQPECMGATVADYDCDGRLDLYILYQRDWSGGAQGVAEKWVSDSQSGKDNELWRNVGGKFLKVTEQAGAGGGPQHTHSAAWFFYDDDRFPDLYAANDFGKNVLLRNQGDGSFEDVSEGSAAAGFSTSMGVAAGDLNNDGVNEIYVANMFSKMGRRIIAHVDSSDYPEGIYDQIVGSCAGNQLYTRASPEDPFVECGEDRGVSQVGWAFGPALADFNNDGLLDIYSTTGFMSFQPGKPDG